jgi:predicted kinase
MKLLLVTGLPGTGKTTLARQLASRYAVALLGKDLIKEPLLNTLGAATAPQSRLLSDASFAVLFAMAREFVAANIDLVLEGNFRPGEHEEAVAALAAARLAQVLCRIDEPARVARLAARKLQRHAGHRDADPAVIMQRSSNEFLDLPGERLAFDGGELPVTRQIDAIDRWWRQG